MWEYKVEEYTQNIPMPESRLEDLGRVKWELVTIIATRVTGLTYYYQNSKY